MCIRDRFNLCRKGTGVAAVESPVPRSELIEFQLNNDQLRIDGNMAIAWSSSLNFTVEKSTRSLIGSAVSGEGLVLSLIHILNTKSAPPTARC